MSPSGIEAGRARQPARWQDEDEEEPLPRRWTAEEASRLRDQRTSPSPWRVVLVQVEVGAVASVLAGLAFGRPALWSALFGAATAIGPSALMARGATRMVNSRSPLLTAMGLLGWESMKIMFSVAMLLLATRVLHPAVWPALLAVLAACLAVYWVALTWRAR